ncbi:MAG: beta-galactosidase [Planctomycetes bacterium]|nr:beta-galactosidase [Planctomycetota bacterium]
MDARKIFPVAAVVVLALLSCTRREDAGPAPGPQPPVTKETPAPNETPADGGGAAAGKVEVTETAGQVAIENDKVKVVIDKTGGIIRSYVYKPEVELIGRGGALQDVLERQGYFRSDYKKALYKVNILRPSDQEATIRMEGIGSNTVSGIKLAFIHFFKTVSLKAGDASIDVRYTVTVTDEWQNDGTQWVAPWFRANFNVAGRSCKLCYPVNRVEEIPINTGDPNRELRSIDITRAWQAVISENLNVVGLAVEAEYPLVERFNAYIAPGEQVTMNAMLRKVPLKQNESINTYFRLTPVRWLKKVDGVGGCTVGSIEVEGGGGDFKVGDEIPLLVKVVDGKQREIEVVKKAKLLPAGEEMEIGRTKQSGCMGRVEGRSAFTPQQPGTYAVYAQVFDNGKMINDVRTFVVVGTPTAESVLRPYEEKAVLLTAEQKAGLAEKEKAKYWLDISMESPHVKWAKPLAGGKPKVLLLANEFRQVAELAQRLDMDWHTAPPGDAKTLEEEMGGKYDCVVVGGLGWGDQRDAVPQQQKILSKLEGGCGIVYVAPFGMDDELAKYLPVKSLTNWRAQAGGTAAAAKLHPVTVGVPFGLFPATDRMDYELADDAVVAATVGGKPLVVVREIAGRRSVVICWNARGGMLPRFSIDDYPKYDYDWWEPHYQLLAKAILWASKRESDVAVTSIRVPGAARAEEAAAVVFREDFNGGVAQPWHGTDAPGKGLDGSGALAGEPVQTSQRIGLWAGGGGTVYETPAAPEETWLSFYYYAEKQKPFNAQMEFMVGGERQGWAIRIREPETGKWTFFQAPLSSMEGADQKPPAGTPLVDMSIFIPDAPGGEFYAIDNFVVSRDRIPEALVRSGGVAADIPVVAVAEGKVEVNVASSAVRECLVEARWCDRHGATIEKSSNPVSLVKGDNLVALDVPRSLRGGVNRVDVFLRQKADDVSAVLDFASGAFAIDPAIRVTSLQVVDAKDYYVPADSVKIAVDSSGGGEVVVSLVDTWGRVVEQKSVPAGSREVDLPLKRTFTKMVYAMAEAVSGGVSQHDVRTPVYIRQPAHATDEFRYTICLTFPTEYHYMKDLFGYMRSELGMLGGWITRPWSNAYIMRAHIRNNYEVLPIEYFLAHSSNHNWMERNYFPRVKKWHETHDTRWLWRCPLVPMDQNGFPEEGAVPKADVDYASWPPDRWLRGDTYHCLNDKAYLDWVSRRIDWIMKPIAKYDPWFYDLGDEMSFTTYMKEHDFDFSPKALEAFREWLKTEYASLEELNGTWQTDFAAWEDVVPFYAEKVRERKTSYAPWVDHRTFSNITYNEFVEHTWKCARRTDPDACMGIGGSQTAAPYGGWDWWLVMNHFTWTEPYISGTTGEMIRSWNTPDKKVRVNPGQSDKWHSLLEGYPGSLQWVDTHFLNPDFSLTSAGEALRRRMKEIYRDGYGTLFLKARHVNDPVAIHYSHATVNMDYIAGGNARDSRTAWVSLVEDMAMQLEYVSYEQLEKGVLEYPRYKVFIMPSTSALSDEECTAAKKWVEAGGVLVTDTNIGRWDEHGAPRDKGFLEEYFGIDSGKAAEKQVGQGWVLHLASNIHDYNQDRQRDPSRRRKMISDILAKAGVAPRMKIAEGGRPALTTETFYHELGGIEYVSIRAGSQKLDVTMPRKAHIYELRGRKYLGLTDTASIATEPTMPALYALLPYRVTGIEATAPDKIAAGADLKVSLQVRGEGEVTGTHVVRVRLHGPDGAERLGCARTILAKKGAGEITLPLAYNDAKGRWTVNLLDLSTGTAAAHHFEIE